MAIKYTQSERRTVQERRGNEANFPFPLPNRAYCEKVLKQPVANGCERLLKMAAAGLSGVSSILKVTERHFRINYVRASVRGRVANARSFTIRARKRGSERTSNWNMVEEDARLFLEETSSSVEAMIHCNPVEGPRAPPGLLAFLLETPLSVVQCWVWCDHAFSFRCRSRPLEAKRHRVY